MSGVGDPFGERHARLTRRWHQVLGMPVCFEADHAKLLTLADAAFAGSASQVASRDAVHVRLHSGANSRDLRRIPPLPQLFSAPGLLGCVMRAGDFACVQPDRRRASVSVSPALLAEGYHARYELLEFATLTLLARVHGLVPLHAACFGRRGRAALLLGDSGTGKSTACLAALTQGLEFVGEDSVFVHPRLLHASGLNAFLHLRPESLRFAPRELRPALNRAPRIRRRGGVRKIEFDLRGGGFTLASGPVQLTAIVRLSRRPAGASAALRELAPARMLATLEATQPYARRQEGWVQFREQVSKLPAFELRRVDPARAIAELSSMLERSGR